VTEKEALDKIDLNLVEIWSASRCGLAADEPKMVIHGDSLVELREMAAQLGYPFETTPWDVTRNFIGKSFQLGLGLVLKWGRD
jgi:hypothetical protein